MKTLFLTAALLVTVLCAKAQDTLQSQPVPSLPQGHHGAKGEDNATMKEDRVEVSRGDLPPLMKTALQHEEKYAGWEKGTVYFEKNSDQYIVHIVKENTTETFRFDKKGKAITSEGTLKEEEVRQ
jgi:hypothetical protein